MIKHLFLFFTSVFVIAAQDISVQGTVTNEAGNAVEGAVVTILDANLNDTSNSDGHYNISGIVGIKNTKPAYNPHINSIKYENNKFRITSSVSGNVLIQLYNMRGVLVADIFKGHLKKGNNTLPFKLHKYGCNAFLIRIKQGSRTISHKFISTGSSSCNIFSHSVNSSSQSGLARTAQVSDWIRASKEGYSTHIEQLGSFIDTVNIVLSQPSSSPDFGPNVKIYDPSMAAGTIQDEVDDIYFQQEYEEFSSEQYAILLKPGDYNLDIKVGYDMHVGGLGFMPDDVTVTGAVRARAKGLDGGNVTTNFWRSCSNIAVEPTVESSSYWAVSQAAPMRRMHIYGDMEISDGGWASGGFIADSKIEGTINSGSQQQWFTRNSELGSWNGSVWNMCFMGVTNAPSGDSWPNPPYTTIDSTPRIREKPFLYVDGNDDFYVFVPSVRDNAKGCSWTDGSAAGESISIDRFYITDPGADNAASINSALAEGKNLIIPPGLYHLEESINVTRPGTIVLGLGFPSLIPDNGDPAIAVSDVGGVIVSGDMIIEGGAVESPSLLQIGEEGSSKDHSDNPVFLFDIFCRTGGREAGVAASMVTINSNNVIADHFWLWRADHGTGVGWSSNACANGLIVNGNDVTVYGHCNEHNQEYQTLWNGEGGRNYFYQCEMPYDAPDQDSWTHDGIPGWAGYKVADHVQTHEAWGMGVYCVFHTEGINADNGYETPTGEGIQFHNIITIELGNSNGTILNVINGIGGTAPAEVAEYP